jgi:BMFP domain-containing protein YqiC
VDGDAGNARMNNAQELSAELDERVFHQQLRIVRQIELVAKLEQRDDCSAVLARARSVLDGLEFGLADLLGARAHAKRKAAKPRLVIVPSDATVH